MAHSIDLRARVVAYVRGGGSKAEAARRFSVGRSQVYAWLQRGDKLAAQKPGPKGAHKLPAEQLARAVQAQPDLCLHELARQFGVCVSTVHYGLKRLRITRKKNFSVHGKSPP